LVSPFHADFGNGGFQRLLVAEHELIHKFILIQGHSGDEFFEALVRVGPPKLMGRNLSGIVQTGHSPDNPFHPSLEGATLVMIDMGYIGLPWVEFLGEIPVGGIHPVARLKAAEMGSGDIGDTSRA
jgi:hypothetical protein